MFVRNGVDTCPRCFLEAENEEEDERYRDEVGSQLTDVKRLFLSRYSIIEDESIKFARFDTFDTVPGTEEDTNKNIAINLAQRMIDGEQMTLWIYSPITGVGKSHLAMSMLKMINDTQRSCLFLDIDAMLRKVRASFRDPDSIYTEQYFIDKASEVDFLVLDDLGAETGDTDTEKKASDYTSRFLKAIANNRQTKSTIITTNIDSQKLVEMYDRKVVSRMSLKRQVIKFVNSIDKRMGDFF